MTERLGAAGQLAAAFIESKLTPLFIVASLALGAMAVVGLPREEEPQIIVPMVDVFVGMPGASPAEVEQRVTRPVEQLLWEVPGVEYIYSTSSPGQSMVIVRFHVGQNEEDALVRLNQKLQANLDRIPPGASAPMVKPRSIDDVPILALTLWSTRYDDHTLRRLATQIDDAIKEVPDVSEVTILGGRPRQMRVDLDPAQLTAYGVDPLQVKHALASTNQQMTTTGPIVDGHTVRVQAGTRLRSVEDVGNVVVTVRAGRPVLVRDVASVRDGDGEPDEYVLFHSKASGAVPAVTIAMAKRKGTNAITVAHAIERKIDTLRGSVIPSDVELTVTRHYGETSSEKSNELLWHMFLAVVSVSALIWIALGRREAVVVLVAIPVTLALTLFLFYLYGYTLNRITLFALIFSIGILVDDAIVVVENVVRHARLQTGTDEPFAAVALRAVDEVGNPTILATLTVVAAILPMAFVGGLMGPYMRPIPIGASAAMLFSLVVAFVVTPWAARRLLASHSGHHQEAEDKLTLWYRKAMGPLITNRRTAYLFLGGVAALLLAAVALIPLKAVKVKMLPFDNKSEFQIIIDMPEGTPLEDTQRVVSALAVETMKDPAVVHVQSYASTAAPYNFNGLVRHYFLRRAPHLADLQVNLVGKDARSDQSHEIAKRIRTALAPIAARNGATIQVAEVPPGPPVLQTLVAEIYGPDEARRTEIASQVKAIFEKTSGVVDTDWYVESPQTRIDLVVDQEKAAAVGVPTGAVAAVVTMASAGDVAGLLHDEEAREDVPIVLRLPRDARSDLGTLAALRINGTAPIAIGEVTRRREATEARARYHKNLQAVTYVTGDLAGASESPVYAIADMNEALAEMKLPEGYTFDVFNAVQPFDSSKYAMKWDGEWHITIEVFRDLGLAFAVVLLLIYILVVGWFQSFSTPFTIMVAIPFSLVGILPAHALMGAFFTATSMIGFIAGAGIVVRNSIILVDFIELRVKDGMPLAEAVIDAGAVRFRPMALTAAAVVVGSAVILFDPIFQGLAISLMAGEVASLVLSRVAVPVMYYLSCVRSGKVAPAPASDAAVC
jgi:multidrug efflux pump subunit AcrB